MDLHIFTSNKEALFSPALEQQLKSHFTVFFHTRPQPLKALGPFGSDKVVALDPDFFEWKFTKEDIEALGPTKAICLQTTSFSWIDTAAAKALNIPVINLRGFSTEAVAEYALMLALGVARKMPLVAQSNFRQDFVAHQGIELRGKKAGVIGLGRIGTRIAELAHGMGMDVAYWSKNTRNNRYTYKEIDDLLKSCDVIFVALAKNDQTKNILTDARLRTMSRNSIFISVAHDIYNQDLIIDMVQKGLLYGCGFEADNASPTQYKGNVYSLPALAWATKESMAENARQWVEAMISAKESRCPNKIN